MLIWLALAIFVVVSVAATIVAVRRGLALFRDFKRLTRGLGDGVDGIARSSGEIEHHLQAAARSGSSLEASLARLHTSRSALAVLTGALAEIRASIGNVTGVVPRRK